MKPIPPEALSLLPRILAAFRDRIHPQVLEHATTALMTGQRINTDTETRPILEPDTEPYPNYAVWAILNYGFLTWSVEFAAGLTTAIEEYEQNHTGRAQDT